MNATDLDLLRQFTRENSQDAFTEIVRRHVDLVYSAALRQVRSPQLAQEVAQSVFSDLAHNAGKLRSDTILTAWLYAVARRTAVDVIRKESRRQLREQVAVEMNTMNATANDWREIEPMLDEAMAALDETDRSVILLRYFENKSLREVGESLKISDDAAQKRASRAVEQLREFFSKRRLAIGASGLAALISANAVQSAPVGLAAAISGAAVSTAVITTTKAIGMTILQKTIISAALAAAVGTGAFEAHHVSQLREQNETLQGQQAPLTAQIQQLQQELNDATNQIAGLMEENGQLKSNSNEDELLKLRNEVTQFKNGEAMESQNRPNDPIEGAALEAADKIKLLRQYLVQHPDKEIPELQFTTEKDWADAVWESDLKTDDDYREALSKVRETAENEFLNVIMKDAFKKYLAANNGVLPGSLLGLVPYFNMPVTDEMLQRYTLLQTGHPDNSKTLVMLSTFADKDYDSDHEMSINGASGGRFNTVSGAVQAAAEAYAKDNGQRPTEAAQIMAYLKKPISADTVQKYLDEPASLRANSGP